MDGAGPTPGPPGLSGQTVKYFVFIRKVSFSQKKGQAQGRGLFYFLIKCHLLSLKQLSVSYSALGQINISVTGGMWGKARWTALSATSFTPALLASCGLTRPAPFRTQLGPAWPRVPAPDSLTVRSPSVATLIGHRSHHPDSRGPSRACSLRGPSPRQPRAGDHRGALPVQICHFPSALTESLIKA